MDGDKADAEKNGARADPVTPLPDFGSRPAGTQVQGADPADERRAILQDIQQQERRIEGEERRIERGESKIQRTIMWTGIAVAMITATYAFFSYRQWQALEDANRRTDTILNQNMAVIRGTGAQLRAMVTANALTGRVAGAADASAGSARAAVEETRKQTLFSRQAL